MAHTVKYTEVGSYAVTTTCVGPDLDKDVVFVTKVSKIGYRDLLDDTPDRTSSLEEALAAHQKCVDLLLMGR
jgi:hypothetical protein